MNFGIYLREQRKKAGLTIYRLARLSGVPWTTIKAYEVRGVSPSIEKADLLLKAMGASLTIGKQE